MLLNMVKQNKVDLDFSNYAILLRGAPKIGKTSLYHEIIKAKYGEQGGLLIPFEKGYSAIDGLNVFPVTLLPVTNINGVERHGWDVFTDIVKEVISTRETNGIKVICIDTIDEFMTVVQNKVCKLSAIETKKPCKSINDAYGGFNRGAEKVKELIKEQVQKLRNAGIGLFFIGHTKYKTLKTKIDKEEYNILGSNLTENYDKMIANDVDMILMITQEPEIKDGVIIGNQRKIRFRSDGFYDVGSRFQYLPEAINCSDNAQETAKNFISVVEDAIKKSANITDESEFKSKLNEQRVEHEAEIKNNIQNDIDKKERMLQALHAFTSNPNTTQAQKIRFVELKNLHNIKFKDKDSVSTEVLQEIIDEFNLKY